MGWNRALCFCIAVALLFVGLPQTKVFAEGIVEGKEGLQQEQLENEQQELPEEMPENEQQELPEEGQGLSKNGQEKQNVEQEIAEEGQRVSEKEGQDEIKIEQEWKEGRKEQPETQLIFGAKGNQRIAAVKPEAIVTGKESKDSFPVYHVSYSRQESDCLKNTGSYGYYGVRVPITVPEKCEIYIEFVGTQTFSGGVSKMITSDPDSHTAGWDAQTTEGLTRYTIKSGVVNPGTYYLVLSTHSGHTQEDASFTTNSFAFRAYYYSAGDKALSSGKWEVMARGNGDDRYYKIQVPGEGHIQVQSDTDLQIAICDSKKKELYAQESWNRLNSANHRTASYFLKKGTYYIRTKGDTKYRNYISKLRYTYYKLGTSPYVFQSGKKVKLYTVGDEKATQYIKYKASATGYVTIASYGAEREQVTLCNASKKAISSEATIFSIPANPSQTILYGVEKGKTYYLKVNTKCSTITLKLTEKRLAEKSGNSRKKAVNLPTGKAVSGSIEIGNKAGDWYKFTLKKRKFVSITMKGRINDGCQFFLYDKKGKKIDSIGTYREGVLNDAYELSRGNNLEKGTYYIKVAGKNPKASGYYTLKWK